MQTWSRTTNVNKAAALATLGIEIQIDRTVDAKTGTGWQTILLATHSATVMSGLVKRPAAAENPLPNHDTQLILSLLQSGKLASADPHHPLLDMLGACANRGDEAQSTGLLAWLKTGRAHRLVRVKGAHRSALVPGDEMESIKQAKQIFRTRDLKLASALTRLGCPVARLEGSGTGVKFCFPLVGFPLDEPGVVVADLVNAYRDDTLALESPEHPLLWMMQCLHNREAILNFMFQQKEAVLLRAPGTGRASLIHRDSPDHVLDRVRKRLGITF